MLTGVFLVLLLLLQVARATEKTNLHLSQDEDCTLSGPSSPSAAMAAALPQEQVCCLQAYYERYASTHAQRLSCLGLQISQVNAHVTMWHATGEQR